MSVIRGLQREFNEKIANNLVNGMIKSSLYIEPWSLRGPIDRYSINPTPRDEDAINFLLKELEQYIEPNISILELYQHLYEEFAEAHMRLVRLYERNPRPKYELAINFIDEKMTYVSEQIKKLKP